MMQFGWDTASTKSLKIVAIDSSDPKIVEYVLKEIQTVDYDFVVLDSLDSISSNPLTIEEIDPIQSKIYDETAKQFKAELR